MNRGRRHAFVNQNLRVVVFLSEKLHAHGLERFTWFDRMREPDFRGVTCAIELGGLKGANGHAAAKDRDGLGMVERIFHDEPLPHIKKTDYCGYK